MQVAEDAVTGSNQRRPFAVDDLAKRLAITAEDSVHDGAVGAEITCGDGTVERERASSSHGVGTERETGRRPNTLHPTSRRAEWTAAERSVSVVT
jgi:hypothetical protein